MIFFTKDLVQFDNLALIFVKYKRTPFPLLPLRAIQAWKTYVDCEQFESNFKISLAQFTLPFIPKEKLYS